MKYILMLLLCACTIGANCQTVQRDANGNYHQVRQPKAKDVRTKYTFSDEHGNVYPIYLSSRGKYYYFKKAKKGNIYKEYIPEGN